MDQKVAKNIERCFFVISYLYISFIANLANSSYGCSSLWLHHKIDQKNINCNKKNHNLLDY